MDIEKLKYEEQNGNFAKPVLCDVFIAKMITFRVLPKNGIRNRERATEIESR